VLTILKAALNHAYRERRCASDDAWRQVRAFREADAARLRYLSDDEARRLTNACPTDFRALVTAALLTGCRYGELTAVIVDDFNPDVGTIRIPVTKSGKPRHVVLTQEGRDFFSALAGDWPRTARMFLRKNGRPWAKSEQQRPLAAACKAAGIAYSISRLARESDVSRSTIYEDIAAGRLIARKIGRRTIVRRADALA
jgi:integrase